MKSRFISCLLFILIFNICGGNPASNNENERDYQEEQDTEVKIAEEILQENLGSYDGLWQEPGVEWIDFNFNTEYILCDDPDGYCAGWEQNASQECKDNYIFKRNLTQEEQENNWRYEG